jgi:hypothetical protein
LSARFLVNNSHLVSTVLSFQYHKNQLQCMALLASLRTYNLLYYRKLPRLLGAGVKEGENTSLHNALYSTMQNAK